MVLSGTVIYPIYSPLLNVYPPRSGVRATQQMPLYQYKDWKIVETFSIDGAKNHSALLYKGRPEFYHLIPTFQLIGGYYQHDWLTGLKLGTQLQGIHYVTFGGRYHKEGLRYRAKHRLYYAGMGGVTLEDKLSLILSIGGQHVVQPDQPAKFWLYLDLSINYHF